MISVDADDFVARALMQMTKHNKRRVAVRRDGEYVGILEDIDLLSFLAGNARLVAARIDRAASVSELAAAASDIQGQTRLLRRQGVKIEVVSEIISDLNRQLLARTFRLLAPESIARRGCLIVMGSEGRGEQTIRTDQDNGLILSEPVPEADLDKFRIDFTAALERYRLSAVSRQRDGAQSDLVEDGRGVPRRFPDLARAQGRERVHECRDLL